jgi:tRNA pseudouridine38-40 synthase
MSSEGRTFRLTIAYDGADYAGWQVQPGQVTIQSEIERALWQATKEKVTIHGSGRTDAGVHALGQVASFRTTNPIPPENLQRAVNRLLPPAIRIVAAEEAPAGFHARFSARGKRICPPHLARYVYPHPFPLDVPAMIAAAPLFSGEHDFSSFSAADAKDALGHSKVRRIWVSEMAEEGPLLLYRVEGSGFLKHMVRNLVGTLIEVGRGNLSAAGVRGLLATPQRARAGNTVPGQGLYLVRVDY